jgi:protein-S-isoprenylcysteine O-methyltransferase Ste14
MMRHSSIADRFVPFLSNLIVIGVSLLFLQYNPYYHSAFQPETQITLLVLTVLYALGGTVYYSLVPMSRIRVTKGYQILVLLRRLFHRWYSSRGDVSHSSPAVMTKEEKLAVLFYGVKLFFLPLMINFVFMNWGIMINQIGLFKDEGLTYSLRSFNDIVFPFLLAGILLVDTFYFGFGYLFEASSLDNTVRSVEPTLIGWLVTLACYPPLNGMVTQLIGWHANENIAVSSEMYTCILHVLILICFAVYLSATIALGAKCSNLTNRGTVSRGPYAYVRHPAYVAKNVGWWISFVPVMNMFGFLSMLAWSGVYYARVITEERHLLQDPDYQAYAEHVRYRFIPGLW